MNTIKHIIMAATLVLAGVGCGTSSTPECAKAAKCGELKSQTELQCSYAAESLVKKWAGNSACKPIADATAALAACTSVLSCADRAKDPTADMTYPCTQQFNDLFTASSNEPAACKDPSP
jgi:hypothetical protein